MRDSGPGRRVDGLLWRERLWLGVISGAIVMAACGPSPIYTRYGLPEVGTGGSKAGPPDGGGSEAATDGKDPAGSGGSVGGVDAGGDATGGRQTGGSIGGMATGGAATGGAATGGAATGGTATGGVAATGGAATGGTSTGGAATGGTATGGASTGNAGAGGAATGGTGRGGAGTGGVGTGGMGTGGRGTGGAATGGSGTGGISASLDPCAGLCTSPVLVELGTGFSSGNLGTGASCFQTREPIAGGNCGNFVSPRTLRVNGVLESCDTGGNWTSLPASRNGGHCIQVTAGDQPWAYLTLW